MQRIHGLRIRCTERLPGLPGDDAATADVEVTVGRIGAVPEPPLTHLYATPAGTGDDHSIEITRDRHGVVCFRYSDGSCANVYMGASPVRIEAVIAPRQTLEDFCAYLYGPILGYVLRAGGVLALHASCVDVDGGAVLFAGESGTGKSTLAAYFAQRGHAVLSDDLTALRQDHSGFRASPAFDHVRLWRASEQMLFGRSDALDTITPTWDKLRFPLTGGAFAAGDAPVRAVYLLDDPGDSAQFPEIRALPPQTALLSLTTLTYANYLLDARARATELAQLGALVRSVPVHWLAAHREGAHLGALRDRVLAHLASLPAAVPA